MNIRRTVEIYRETVHEMSDLEANRDVERLCSLERV